MFIISTIHCLSNNFIPTECNQPLEKDTLQVVCRQVSDIAWERWYQSVALTLPQTCSTKKKLSHLHPGRPQWLTHIHGPGGISLLVLEGLSDTVQSYQNPWSRCQRCGHPGHVLEMFLSLLPPTGLGSTGRVCDKAGKQLTVTEVFLELSSFRNFNQ